MKDPYALAIETAIALSKIYLKRISLSVFTIETSRIWPLNYFWNIFPTKVLHYNLRSQTDFFRNTINTTKFGLDLLRYFASKVWSIILTKIKNFSNTEMFKNKISKSEPNHYDYKLCQDYFYRNGYVNLVDD